MSTRCTLTVHGDGEAFSVYRHSDGYPDGEHGVLNTLKAALSYAWPLPRFEADDFAAAIVAAWKRPGYRPSSSSPDYIAQGGNIRLMTGDKDSVGDSEFHYDLRYDAKHRAVAVTTMTRRADDSWRKIGKVTWLCRMDQPPVPAPVQEESV